MQRDVRLGLVIGVLFLALIVVIYIHREREFPPGVEQFQPTDIGVLKYDFDTEMELDSRLEPGVEEGGDVDLANPVETGPSRRDETQIYTVLSGDSLWKIAQQLYGDGKKGSLIYEANKSRIKDKNELTIGQKLVIPAMEHETPLVLAAQESEQRTHVVQKDDTLYSIAKRYYGDGSKWKVILDANRQLESERSLPVGMTIVIP